MIKVVFILEFSEYEGMTIFVEPDAVDDAAVEFDLPVG